MKKEYKTTIEKDILAKFLIKCLIVKCLDGILR